METPISCKFACRSRADPALDLRIRSPPMGTPFRHRIRVRWNECDLQGVVFYANYLMYFDVAMTELWREAVEPFGDMNATGADMVVAEARIAYRASAVRPRRPSCGRSASPTARYSPKASSAMSLSTRRRSQSARSRTR